MSYQLDWNISLDCVTKEALLERLNNKSNFVLVDTIGTYDGNTVKIKGATTIPYVEVIDRRKELLPYDEIIEVASALKMLNVRNVKVYEGGIDEWLENNLPTENV